MTDYDRDSRGVDHVYGEGCQCDRRGTMDAYRCEKCQRLWGFCIGNDLTELCDECDVGAEPRRSTMYEYKDVSGDDFKIDSLDEKGRHVFIANPRHGFSKMVMLPPDACRKAAAALDPEVATLRAQLAEAKAAHAQALGLNRLLLEDLGQATARAERAEQDMEARLRQARFLAKRHGLDNAEAQSVANVLEGLARLARRDLKPADPAPVGEDRSEPPHWAEQADKALDALHGMPGWSPEGKRQAIAALWAIDDSLTAPAHERADRAVEEARRWKAMATRRKAERDAARVEGRREVAAAVLKLCARRHFGSDPDAIVRAITALVEPIAAPASPKAAPEPERCASCGAVHTNSRLWVQPCYECASPMPPNIPRAEPPAAPPQGAGPGQTQRIREGLDAWASKLLADRSDETVEAAVRALWLYRDTLAAPSAPQGEPDAAVTTYESTLGRMLTASEHAAFVWACQHGPAAPAAPKGPEPGTVYLAARFSRAPELRQRRDDLQALGYKVTSRWLEDPRDLDDAAREAFAAKDMEDVRRAAVVVSFTEEPRAGGRGGRHVEFGMALALGRRCIVVGPREHVFHFAPNVEHFETWNDAVVALCREPCASLFAFIDSRGAAAPQGGDAGPPKGWEPMAPGMFVLCGLKRNKDEVFGSTWSNGRAKVTTPHNGADADAVQYVAAEALRLASGSTPVPGGPCGVVGCTDPTVWTKQTGSFLHCRCAKHLREDYPSEAHAMGLVEGGPSHG